MNMASNRLTDLPSELQTAIISWIFRPDDLANICLVSKQLYDIAVPLLYHSVTINVDHWPSEHLDRFLTPGHRGHRHVRALDIDSVNLKTESLALKAAKDAVHIFPRDRLQTFRCPLETGVDNDLMILLAAKQRKLAFIGIGPLLLNSLTIPECLLPWPHNIETLVIPWKIFGQLDLYFYQNLIKRSTKTLKALTIRTEKVRPPWDKHMMNDRNTSEYMANGLFGHCLPAGNHPMLELNDLNFQNQDLSLSKDTWLHFIDFMKLRTLQIWNCENVSYLLDELQNIATNDPSALRLHGLVLSFEDATDALIPAMSLLSRTSGLQYLNLCFPQELLDDKIEYKTSTFNTGCLEKHRETLQDAYLGIGANNTYSSCSLYVPSNKDLGFISSCQRLRQLALALPPIRLDEVVIGQWGEFGRAVETLAMLPRLKTLRILTWPLVSEWDFAPEDWNGARQLQKTWYLKRLDILANSIAHLICRLRDGSGDRLSVLTFGSAERTDRVSHVNGDQDYPFNGPITYKVRRKETEFGFVVKAKRIDAHLMEYEEPVAYVVDEDTDQGLSLEAYPWGGQY